MSRKDKIETIEQHIKSLEEYILSKLKQRDWHGVTDAAVDIRELEAEIKGLKTDEGLD